jgi:hypothetical protein
MSYLHVCYLCLFAYSSGVQHFVIHIISVIYTYRTPLEISGNTFMGHPWKYINLQVHFKLTCLGLFHIFKLHKHLYIVDID